MVDEDVSQHPQFICANQRFKTLFENLDGTPTATLGILSPDSTVVYYKIHRGIVKPKEVDSDEDDEPKETDD